MCMCFCVCVCVSCVCAGVCLCVCMYGVLCMGDSAGSSRLFRVPMSSCDLLCIGSSNHLVLCCVVLCCVVMSCSGGRWGAVPATCSGCLWRMGPSPWHRRGRMCPSAWWTRHALQQQQQQTAQCEVRCEVRCMFVGEAASMALFFMQRRG